MGGDGHGDHAHADAVADQQDAADDPPPGQPLASDRALAGRDRGRTAGGATGGEAGAEQCDQDQEHRRDDGGDARVVGHRVGHEVAMAQQREQPAASEVGEGRARGGGDQRHEGRLGADQPPSLARRRADGAQQADLDLALGDGDADRRDDGEQDDQGPPAADHGADRDEGLPVGRRDVPGGGADQRRERAHQGGAQAARSGTSRVEAVARCRSEARARRVMTPPPRPARRGGPSGRPRRRRWARPCCPRPGRRPGRPRCRRRTPRPGRG